MNNDRATKNLWKRKKTVIESKICISIAIEDSREITDMIRMCSVCRIVMHAGVGKIIAAITVFVQMKS